MKILHILGQCTLPRNPDAEGASGIVRAALEIARAQVCLGHEVYIAAVGDAAWRSHWHGVRLVGLASAPWARMSVKGKTIDFRRHVPYALLTRRQAFDVVQGHLYGYMRFLRAGQRIVHFHSDPFFKGRRNEGLDLKPADFATIARNSNAQIAVSQFLARELERGFAARGNVHVVYNGVDMLRFDPNSTQLAGLRLRQRLGLAKDAVLLLFAGAIVPEKGVLHLARVFAQLAADLPDLHLALAGTGTLWGGPASMRNGQISDYEQAVRRVLEEPFARGRAHFLGKVAASDMPAAYAASDVVVIPSIWREVLSLVALEALASGRPVIASSTGGLVEAVNEQNGWLVPPGDESALAEAVRALALDPAQRHQLGAAARQQARQFSWDVAAQQLDAIYTEVLARRAV